MKVNQISSILNSVFGEVLGEGNLFAEDLSNIVSAGTTITSSTEFGQNFENYAGKIVDKVGKVVFVSRVYQMQDLGIWRDSWEYGSVLEKIRVEVGDYVDNAEWTLLDSNNDGTPDYNEGFSSGESPVERLFKFYPAKVRAKYFNLKTTFRSTISIAEKQLRSAFRSASEMARFIGMIEQRIQTKMEIAKDQLQRKVLTNFMGERIYGGGATCVDLQAEYAAATGDTSLNSASLAVALHTEAFVKFMAERIKKDRKLMAAPSSIYSNLDAGFYNHTPREDARLIVLDDVDTALSFYLYGDTYHNEFVTLDGYRTIPFWQGSGRTMAIADRSAINVSTTNEHIVNRGGIIGVLFDRDAVMICNDDPEVTSQYNPDGRFTNFFYNADCSYYNDFDENGIVYVWGAGAVGTESRGDFGITLAVGTSNAGDTKATVASGTTGTLKGKVYAPDEVPFVQVGSAFDVTGFASFTAGTAKTLGTSDGVEAGAVLLVVALDANSKVTGSATITIPADKIKAS